MVKLFEINRTAAFAWSNNNLPYLASGTIAGAIDLDFNSSSKLEIWDPFQISNNDDNQPVVSLNIDSKVYALDWSKPFDDYSLGLLAGALENGSVEFWNPLDLINNNTDVTNDANPNANQSIFSGKKHTSSVKSLKFNPIQTNLLASAGLKGEFFIWDSNKFGNPIVPGQPMNPIDEINSIDWNNNQSHILATAGNTGYTSIWDLKHKKEIIHLNYTSTNTNNNNTSIINNRANLSLVKWHPSISTKLITASDSDYLPVILSWDLRNTKEPLLVLNGHKKGILSIDWCKSDENLLLSSSKDNSSFLWNPITGERLVEYPSTTNWPFDVKFSPKNPDYFATASFDNKIVIQSLQDTTPASLNKSTDQKEDEFWSQISSNNTIQNPLTLINQAPKWYSIKNPTIVKFSDGGKLITIKNNLNNNSNSSTIKISNYNPYNSKLLENSIDLLKTSLSSNLPFEKLIQKLSTQSHNNSDYNLLAELINSNKKSLIKDHFKYTDQSEPTQILQDQPPQQSQNIEDSIVKDSDDFFSNFKRGSESKPTSQDDDSFFNKINDNLPYIPQGNFKIINPEESNDDQILKKAIILGNLESAVNILISQDKLNEAFLLAINSNSKSLLQRIKNEYFKKNSDSSLSRLLYNIDSKSKDSIDDLITNGDLSNWVDISLAVSTYVKDNAQYNTVMSELGDRLLSSKISDSFRDDAILCFLSSGSLDEISKIWLSEIESFEQEILETAGLTSDEIKSPSDAYFKSLNSFIAKVLTFRKYIDETYRINDELVVSIFLKFLKLLLDIGQVELTDKILSFLPNDSKDVKTEK
ncbi:Sec31p, partial [Ascoidea rubescens DSM 1968]